MMRRFARLISTLVFALCLSALSAWGQTLPESSPHTSVPGVVIVATPAELELAPISLDDVIAIEEAQVSEASIARFEVSVEAARSFAFGYVTERGGYDEPLWECLYLPKVDVDGRVLAHFFLFSTDGQCADFAHLSAQATGIVAGARSELHGAGPPSALQHAAHLLSASDYYSITVSAYSFRPPVQLGHRGLPLFLMTPPELPGHCAEPVVPEQIVLAHLDELHEAVGYRCAGELILFSAYAGQLMSPEESLQPDLAGTLLRWRTNVLYSGDFAAEGLERLNRRWRDRIALGQRVRRGGVQ